MHKYNQYPPIRKTCPLGWKLKRSWRLHAAKSAKIIINIDISKAFHGSHPPKRTSHKTRVMVSYDFLHSRLTFSIFLGWLCFRLRSRAY